MDLALEIILSNVLSIVIFVLFIYSAIVSLQENEKRAAKYFLLFAILVAVLFFIPFLLQKSIGREFALVLEIITASSLLVVFFPFSAKKVKVEMPIKKYDERDVMFSRNTLVPGTEKFETYYKDKPDKKNLDDKFRMKPGLLKKGTLFYHPFTFASAEANFFTVSALKEYIDGEKNVDKVEIKQDELTKYLKGWAKKLGAISVGITEMKDYHFYSHKGRGEIYGNEINNTHRFGIAFSFEMDKEMIDSAPQGTAVMESAQQYLVSGTVAVQIAAFIRELGYEAKAHIDGNYEVVCPLVARDAGLGEIGRMGLLMTPELGPRVRLSVVTTDIPLLVDELKQDDSMIDFCEKCKKCALVCPSHSISLTKRREIDGILRWKINSEACFTFWSAVGTDCGRCMSVCPYAHPNNLLHNFIRFGIKHFPVFRTIAVKLDDLFYGKRPTPKKFPDWISF